MLIEGWGLLDAVYMTAISLTTVGYTEVNHLSNNGRIFTILLITLGVGFYFYAFTVIAEEVMEGHIRGVIRRRQMEKQIARLKDHFIVCGYGRLGRVICQEIRDRNDRVVVIENDEAVVKEIEEEGLIYIQGDATKDEVLQQAGLERSRGIITVLGSDAANIYITISARSLYPEAFIVSRAEDESAELKMLRAGADKVINPYKIGAVRMALAALQPALTEFLDIAAHEVRDDLEIAQIPVGMGSELGGRTIREIDLRSRFGVTILAIKKRSQHLRLHVQPDDRLDPGDILIVWEVPRV